MIYNIFFYFLLFVSYSFFGWVVETITCSITEKRLVLDRGFLIGPYCPIYGGCSLFLLLFSTRYLNDPVMLFILTMIAASILEYVTSVLMEKLFKARWWDYSHMPFNIEGRICLLNAFLFGILGLVFVYFINPFYSTLLKKLPSIFLMILTCIVFLGFLIDLLISFSIMTKLKLNIKNFRHDASAEIDKEMKRFLANHHFFTKRLFRAFPKVQISVPRGDKIIENVKTKLEELDLSHFKKRQKVREEKEKIRHLKEMAASHEIIQEEELKLKKLKKSKID